MRERNRSSRGGRRRSGGDLYSLATPATSDWGCSFLPSRLRKQAANRKLLCVKEIVRVAGDVVAQAETCIPWPLLPLLIGAVHSCRADLESRQQIGNCYA